MMTTLETDFGGEVGVKESYSTVKRRLLDASSFIEVTTNGHKLLLNKFNIQGVAPVPTAEESKKKKK